MTLPGPFSSDGMLVDVTRDGRLTFATDSEIWESSPLFELLPVE